MAQTLLLNLTNPMNILSFIAIFAGLADHHDMNTEQAIAMVGGIAIGSMIWWLILGFIVIKVKVHLSGIAMVRIRYASAAILAIFGIWSIASGFIY